MRGRTVAPAVCLAALWALGAQDASFAEPPSRSPSSSPSLEHQSAWSPTDAVRDARLSGRSRKRKKRRHRDEKKGSHDQRKAAAQKHKGSHDQHKGRHNQPQTPPGPAAVHPPPDSDKPAAEPQPREDNFPMEGVRLSPLRKAGVPAPAVPVVATAVSVSLMALWPSVEKAASGALRTLGTILRQVISTHLRVFAKRGKKLDESERHFVLFGFRLRPLELLSLAATAAVYGLALAYLLVGWALSPQLLLWQILASLLILLIRSLVRFFYERQVGLVTVFRFWPAGGLLCLFSAYLGTMMATGNYELEGSGRPEAAQSAPRLRVGIVLVTLGLALGFFAVNLYSPHKVLQVGRLVASGIVLSEVLPVAPMPGLRIYKWSRGRWALLFGLVVPSYFLVNFLF